MPPDPQTPRDETEQLAQQLALNLQQAQSLFQTLLTEIQNRAKENAQIDATITGLKRTIEDIHKTVNGEGGEAGLVTKFALMLQEVAAVKKCIEDEKRKKEDEERDKKRVRWDIIIAVVSGILGLAGAVIALLKK